MKKSKKYVVANNDNMYFVSGVFGNPVWSSDPSKAKGFVSYDMVKRVKYWVEKNYKVGGIVVKLKA